ncbi:MAG: SAP domain-containing protein [Candidatus Thalassarchaeaceae archaeon]|nr:SAP domain-containing protein [Candidatus Thalassarchaeaceae archaeon]
MVSGGKKSGKTVEDVFKSGMDDMIRAREELDAAEAESEASKVVETVQPASADPLLSSAPSGPPMPDQTPTGPPMPEVAPEPEPAPDPLLAPPTPTGPPMPEAAPEPEPTSDPLLTPPTPMGPPMGGGPMPPMGGPGMPPMGGPGMPPMGGPGMPPMGGPGMPPMGGPGMPPMGGGPMPPMGGPGPMPPGGPGPMPPSGPSSEDSAQIPPADVPTEAPSMSVDSSAMPPMGSLGPSSADPLATVQPADPLATVQPADPPTAEPVVDAPPQVTEKPKVDNFDAWESHFDNEWKGGVAVYEGENAPPEPEEKFDEVSWDSSAKPVKTIPQLPTKAVMNKMKKADLVELAEGREVSSDGTKDQIIERLLAPEADDSEDLPPITEESPTDDADPIPLEVPLADDSESTATEDSPEEDVDLMSIAGSLTDDADSAPPSEPPADGPGPMPPAGPPAGPGPMPPSGPPKGGPGPMPPSGPPKGGPGPMPPSGPPTDE